MRAKDNSLNATQRIALQAALEIGQIERSCGRSAGFGRRHHWRTIDLLVQSDLMTYINSKSAVLTERGIMIAEALVSVRKSLEAARREYFGKS